MGPAVPSTSAMLAPVAPGLQRSYIWSGVIEWMWKGQSLGDQQKTNKYLPCQVSPNTKGIDPELKVDTWPNKLLMQLMPKQLISSIGGQYLKDTKSVLFHLQPSEALDALTKVMVNGFAGCVLFVSSSPPQCHIKVLFLLYTPDKKAYLGFIPNNQTTFIDRLRKVIQQEKMSQKINKQMPAVGGSSRMLPNLPQSTAGSSGMAAGSLGGVSQMGQPQIQSQQHQMAVKRKSCILEALVEWQVDNPKDREILERIKNLAAIYLPEGWQQWKVVVHTREDLLGEDLDLKTLNKIRFCLPTVDLARAFSPDATSLSKKVYKDMKLKMLEWPFCIGLIIDPPFVAAKIRGSAIHNELVNASLADLKHLLISRKDASKELEDNDDDDDVSTVRSSSSESKNMSRMDKLEQEFSDMKNMLSNFMSRFEPMSDNESEQESYISSDNESLLEHPPSHTLVNSDKHSKAPSPALVEDNEDLDFSPQTREQEPAITTPKPHIEKQGIQCLRLGELNYKQIRYADVQKKLQAFPVFHALKLNPALQKNCVPGASFEALAKQESSFGTILHGLLLQQEALTNVVKDLSSRHPSLKQVLKESLYGPDSAFKCVSDDVLQYVCGRKVEAIEQRRSASLPQDDNLSTLLNNIPPSSTHLFDESQVSELLKRPSLQGFNSGSTAIYKPKFHFQPKPSSSYDQHKHSKSHKRPRSQQRKASSAFDSRKPNKRVPKRPLNARSKDKFRESESKKPRRS